jgi:CelD/BcsL family acetyltransferase involved in cellulose biosynthesis
MLHPLCDNSHIPERQYLTKLKNKLMNNTISEDYLDNLDLYWRNAGSNLDWSSVFVLPPWLEAWWQVFGAGEEIYLRTVRQDGNIIGIAPLRKKGDTALFIGDTDVCDYVDFIVARGHEAQFFTVLMDDLIKNGIRHLELKHVRPDSFTMQGLVPLANERGYAVATTPEEVNVEMDLLSGWDAYLESLSAKQRHEVRRKLRRLQEAGNVVYRRIEDAASVAGAMDTFFRMFVESRRDKAAFLTGPRESFFRRLAANMAAVGLLRLGVLELDGKPVAQIVCFDYNNCIYLYNSGYDPDYVSLSAGLLSKVLAIKDSIEKGKRKFDFLKGPEIYKYHLGGKEMPLYRCLITLEK